MVANLVAVVALALLGSAAWPFAPNALPLHFGLTGYGNFASSWVLLMAIPWSCAAAAVYMAYLARYRERPMGQAAYAPVVISVLLVALTFVAL